MRRDSPGGTSGVDLDRLDLSDPRLYGDGEPHGVWRAMRERQPVRWQPVDGRSGFWAVASYAGAELVLTDHATFTSTRGVFLNMLGREEPASDHQFAATDPPRHGQIRRPVQRELTVRAIRRHAETLRIDVARLLAPALDGGPFDFAEATSALPMAMLGPLLGIPAEDWPRLARLVAMSVAEDDPDYQLPQGTEATLRRAHRELFGYLLNLVVAHRRHPRADLVDVLASMTVGGERLSAGAVVANCYSLLLGASAAIPHVPNVALLELIRSGGYADWAGNPQLLDSGVEEALRWTSPARHFLRCATRTTRLGDVTIAEGDAVVVWIGSANRDERVFSDPYTFDVRRTPNRHLSFGDGPHYCVGASIARLALRTFFAEMFARFSSFELAGEVEHVRSTWLGGVKRLPVVATPR
ncbi:cytochrome P450 [Micromonospora sp. NBC_01699]|uniref:cytochrome P450 n=1 Tax=Micromonospora sp. NBC_01699 TaxID=2975984 RepID=UPI002E2A6042|nr:cytochrome P450 [Micromonospora sp. NBC_01699]